MILELVDRQLAGAHDQLPVARLSDHQRHPLLEIVEMRRWNVLEAGKVDRLDEHRLALGDRDGEIDFVLFVVQLDVETGDARIGEPAIGVERLDALEIGVEPRSIEVRLLAPGDFRALAGGERVLQAVFVDALDALEREAVNLDGSPLFARDARGEDRNGERDDRETHAWH